MDRDGRRPLHVAALAGWVALAEHLLGAWGAELTAADKANRKTPLHFAAEFGHVAVAEHLAALGTEAVTAKALEIAYDNMHASPVNAPRHQRT